MYPYMTIYGRYEHEIHVHTSNDSSALRDRSKCLRLEKESKERPKCVIF